jgi:hypothetical protein
MKVHTVFINSCYINENEKRRNIKMIIFIPLRLNGRTLFSDRVLFCRFQTNSDVSPDSEQRRYSRSSGSKFLPSMLTSETAHHEKKNRSRALAV